ncbi:hypothetical protein INP51_14115 [Blautia liquoris]|uniref:Peptidoglycan hydrolase PcsB coiled-coil domain-containing protein n=1 Tax=Blautia liquoris TaxID=2779518 RepID=A0A7M2RGE8_9FIRM|nr:hypothetical protein [Blautia liquoris]QOV19074.1 hypothetical protein INP51_14115 [Blautia liquoris]
MRDKKRLGLMLVALSLTFSAVPSYAATTQERISDIQAQKKTMESTLEDTRNKIAGLKSKKDQSESYMSDLSGQLTDLQKSLEELKTQSESKEKELEQVQTELESAKDQEAKQYEDMKLRIQYMYENSNSGYLEMLFSSDNFGDFISRAQNMAEISKYDRKMLDDYQAAKEEVQEKENKVLDEQKKIAALQEQSSRKQEQVQELYKATYQQVRTYNEDLDQSHSEEGDLLSRINSQEDTLTQLMVQAKNEEVERQQREAAAAQAALETQAARETQKKQAVSSQAKKNTPVNAGSSVVQRPSGSDNGANNNASTGKSQKVNPTAPSQSDGQGTYLGNFKLTSYCNCEICTGKWAGGATASGTTPTAGRTIAMAGLPFGTKLSINGHVYTVEDRGTQYGHVDIFTGSHADALAFGVRHADVYRLN